MKKKIKAWWAQSKYVALSVLAGVGVILGGVAAALARKKQPEIDQPEGGSSLPPPPRPLQEKVEQVHEEALWARVDATATKEAEMKKLDEIKQIEDGEERRKALADFLKDM